MHGRGARNRNRLAGNAGGIAVFGDTVMQNLSGNEVIPTLHYPDRPRENASAPDAAGGDGPRARAFRGKPVKAAGSRRRFANRRDRSASSFEGKNAERAQMAAR